MCSMVHRVLVESGRAVGVAFSKGGDAELHRVVASREVLLAAGSVQSPQVGSRPERISVRRAPTEAYLTITPILWPGRPPACSC